MRVFIYDGEFRFLEEKMLKKVRFNKEFTENSGLFNTLERFCGFGPRQRENRLLTAKKPEQGWPPGPKPVYEFPNQLKNRF
jgi:hypothetical protein